MKHYAAQWIAMRWHHRILLLEAACVLGLVSASIALLPFRWSLAIASTRPSAPEFLGDRSEAIRNINWAVAVLARAVPWTAVCFQRGLAVHLMLRRRGIASTLYYGARQDERAGLQAHVWVKSGDCPVIGCEEAHRFRVLAAIPPS